MNSLSTITDKNGHLFPSKIVSSTMKLPALHIAKDCVDSYESYDSSSEEDSYSEEDGFYVEISISCVNDENDQEDYLVLFNFGTEDNYMEHADSGFEELESYLPDAVSVNYVGWYYSDKWEETQIYGNEVPDDYEGTIIDIP